MGKDCHKEKIKKKQKGIEQHNKSLRRHFDSGQENSKEIRAMHKVQRFVWTVGPWQKCSRECGRGVQERAVACFDSNREDAQVLINFLSFGRAR